MSDILDINLSEFYKTYKIIHEMMFDRKYISVEPEKTKQEFISFYIGLISDVNIDPYKFCDELTLYFKNQEIPTKKIMIYFHILSMKFKKNDLEAIVNLSFKNDIDKIILILKAPINSRIINVISVLGNKIQVFSQDNLKINITKHHFVPKHELTTKEEAEKMLTYYNATRNSIPGIIITDPIVKWYDWAVGDIIKITRPIPGTKKFEITYRVVCNPKEE